jgi:hypothetical protein
MASTTVIAVAVTLEILVTVTPDAEKEKLGVPENPAPDTVKVYELFMPTVEGEIELTVGTGGAGTVKQSLQVNDVESGLSMVKLYEPTAIDADTVTPNVSWSSLEDVVTVPTVMPLGSCTVAPS